MYRFFFFLIIGVLAFAFPVEGQSAGLADFYKNPQIPEQKIFAATEDMPQWSVLWQEARRKAVQGDLSAAVREYELLLERKADISAARWELASVFLSLQEFDKAAVLLEMLHEQYPDQLEYLNGLGYTMHEKGHYERAVELFERTVQQQPDNLIGITGLGKSLLALKQTKKALPFLEKLYSIESDNVELREQLITLYMKLQLFEKARPLAVLSVKQSHVSLEHVKRAAVIHSALDLDNLAVKYWLQVLSLAPTDVDAHSWLSEYYKHEGRCSEALPHLLLLLGQENADPHLFAVTGRCYQEIQQPQKALSYFEKFLKHYPNDKEVLREMVNILAALGRGDETLGALDRYFQVEPDPSPNNLRQAAKLYDATGRYHDAIPIYRRLLETNPDDPQVLATLAQDLLSIGEDEGALKIWSHLARITPDNKEIYLAMIKLLKQLDRQNELLSLLEELHSLDPNDNQVTLQLTEVLFTRGEFEKGESLFQEVASQEIFSADLLLVRARIFEKLQMGDHALRDYEEILREQPERMKLHFKCLQLAGVLGKLALVHKHFEVLEQHRMPVAERLQIANAFRDGGDFQAAQAIYLKICADESLAKTDRWQSFIDLAASYTQQGLYCKAEQALRQALLFNVDRQTVLVRMVALQIEAGLLDDASIWLTQLLYVDLSAPDSNGSERDIHDDLVRKWLEMKRFNASHRFKAAIRKGKELLVKITEMHKAGRTLSELSVENRIVFEMAVAYLGEQEYDEAEKHCLALIAHPQNELSALVLLHKVYDSQGKVFLAQSIEKRITALAGKDLQRMLLLVRMYEKGGNALAMVQAAREAKDIASDSFLAAFLYAKALSDSGELSQARDIISQLEQTFSDNLALESLAARTTFRMGLYQEALSYCDSVLTRQPDRADMLLLKGRVYWAKLDWQKSLAVYEGYLTPSVENLLAESFSAAGMPFPETPKHSIWQRMRFSHENYDNFVYQIMTPAFAAAPEKEEISRLAAPLYALYRWQQRFARELEARRMAVQGDDFQAVHLFGQLLEEYPDDASLLYDLAGIYSRLDRLGEEALIYERLLQIDADYPGLAAAKERNRLKRQPRMNLSYHYGNEEGRDGYKAMRKNAAELGYWKSLRPGHDVSVAASRIDYSSTESDESLMANRFLASYGVNFLNRLDVYLAVGIESLEDGYDNTGIVHCAINGKVGDRLQGDVSYTRDLVTDTLAALTRNIVAEGFTANLYLGILPRLITGGSYEYTNYSDGNELKGYSLWASYILFSEPTYLQLKYTYEFKDSRETGESIGVLLEDGFFSGDHPYWSPVNFWKNGVGVLWRHKLSADTLERGTPSYYSAEYIFDYDSFGHAIQSVKGGIFLELTRNFIVESAVSLVTSDEYRAKEFTLSAIYRW